MSRRDKEGFSLQEDTFDDDEIEILEVVGLEEDSPAARPVPDEEPEEILLSFDEGQAGDPVAPAAGIATGDAETVEREQYLRLQADFDNFKRRVEREREENERYAAAGVVGRLLPILDNFERAVSASPGDDENGTFRDGVVLIFRQLLDELRREGLESIDTIGQPFDPHLHEAVATDHESGLPSHTVVEELRRGYILRGRVLRPALVKVAMGPSDAPTPSDTGEES
jgi:molecular chaperone GrpE